MNKINYLPANAVGIWIFKKPLLGLEKQVLEQIPSTGSLLCR